ncbi:hypothetical protein BaRGS_00000390 [Batillaria attramentaria]|uniref:F5/8 type C domain-containing protein n=1 Tax=Batillaria attramentaria TaxID=370345 RepID=A0ABD0M9M9_9CAEN
MANIRVFVLLLFPAMAIAVYPNVAVGKVAKQSSTFEAGGAASRAVDGNADPEWAGQSCTHTAFGLDNSWWYVDLGGNYIIQSVVITNRKDCCWERLADFRVEVFEDDPESDTSIAQSCYNYAGAMPRGATEQLTCDALRLGRYVRIAKDIGILTLCEVQVLGKKAYPNVAVGKVAKQSSTREAGGAASRAVDGNADPLWAGQSCTHTETGLDNSWWYVDLGGTYTIQAVVITNRGNACCWKRLADFTVDLYADDPESDSSIASNCYTYPGTMPQGATEILRCKCPRRGRYVRIAKDVGILTLCEVQVLGKQAVNNPFGTWYWKCEHVSGLSGRQRKINVKLTVQLVWADNL